MAVSMTPRERFLTALAGGMPDRLPLTLWNNKLLGGHYDEAVFSLGVCLVVKSCVWKMSLTGVAAEFQETPIPGIGIRKTTRYKTPAGELEVVERILPGTVWIESTPFRSAEDYEALEALIDSRTYTADFERFNKDDNTMRNQSIARPMVIRSPMQELIYEFMGIENFSMEWAWNQDRVIHLEKVLRRDWEKRVRITAESPAQYAVIDGNTTYSVIGPERYQKYYIPRINEACESLHLKGKLAGAHLDGNNFRLAPIVAKTKLDFIESFTPAPETDLSVADARALWPDKALQIHFPSSIHLAGEGAIHEVGRRYLKEAAPGNAFIVGVSEDLPMRGKATMVPFFTFFERHGKLPLKRGMNSVRGQNAKG